MNDILDDLQRYKVDAMRSQDAGRQIVYTRAVDEIERLRAALSDIEFIVDGKEDADDGQPNDAMQIMTIVQAAFRPR